MTSVLAWSMGAFLITTDVTEWQQCVSKVLSLFCDYTLLLVASIMNYFMEHIC